MAKQIQVKLMVAVDEAGEWAVVPVRGARQEAVDEVLTELSSDTYVEVFELVVPVPVPKRPVRTVRVSPEALELVAQEAGAGAEDEEDEVEVPA